MNDIEKENLQKLQNEYELLQERLNISLSAGNLAWWEMHMPEGKVKFNEHKATMLGYDPDDFMDCHYSAFTDLIHPGDYDKAMKAMADHLAGKEELYQVTYRIKAKDGSYRWFYDRGSITEWDEAGRPVKIKGIVFDDTERIEAGIALEKSQKELQIANATKDKFFSILSHDLRNPFSVIMGMAELLRMNYENFTREELFEIFERIKSTSENAFNLMEDILAWSRSQSGQMRFSPEKLLLNDLTQEAIAPYKVSAAKKNISVVIDIEEDFAVVADSYMLKTILRNLFSNAVKFTPAGGNIKIFAGELPTKVSISVEDNGTGMDAETTERLFKIDKNKSSKGTEGEEGTGLGLVLCNDFALRHNGQLRVKSTRGKGSRFSIILPK